jgi:hypothetical protein
MYARPTPRNRTGRVLQHDRIACPWSLSQSQRNFDKEESWLVFYTIVWIVWIILSIPIRVVDAWPRCTRLKAVIFAIRCPVVRSVLFGDRLDLNLLTV